RHRRRLRCRTRAQGPGEPPRTARPSARRRARAERGVAGAAAGEGPCAAGGAVDGQSRRPLKWAPFSPDQGRGDPGGRRLPAGGRSEGRSVESTPGPQVRRGPAGPRPADPVASRLAGQLREIATGAAAPEDMLEPALRAVLEASRVSAGAVCLFDQRHDLLRLAAEVGLSDEGCKRLRQVRRGGMAGWDMPLHGLLNRRVYLIESAARNRYVPPLVDAATSVRAVACVPLYAGTTPVASL